MPYFTYAEFRTKLKPEFLKTLLKGRAPDFANADNTTDNEATHPFFWDTRAAAEKDVDDALAGIGIRLPLADAPDENFKFGCMYITAGKLSEGASNEDPGSKALRQLGAEFLEGLRTGTTIVTGAVVAPDIVRSGTVGRRADEAVFDVPFDAYTAEANMLFPRLGRNPFGRWNG